MLYEQLQFEIGNSRNSNSTAQTEFSLETKSNISDIIGFYQRKLDSYTY